MIANDSLILATKALSDIATNGPIGTAAATVDIAASFLLTQTTAGITSTLPTPTDTTQGHLVAIGTTAGSVNITIEGQQILPGKVEYFQWVGFWRATNKTLWEEGTLAARPAAASFGRDNFTTTDYRRHYRENTAGTEWVNLDSQLGVLYADDYGTIQAAINDISVKVAAFPAITRWSIRLSARNYTENITVPDNTATGAITLIGPDISAAGSQGSALASITGTLTYTRTTNFGAQLRMQNIRITGLITVNSGSSTSTGLFTANDCGFSAVNFTGGTGSIFQVRNCFLRNRIAATPAIVINARGNTGFSRITVQDCRASGLTGDTTTPLIRFAAPDDTGFAGFWDIRLSGIFSEALIPTLLQVDSGLVHAVIDNVHSIPGTVSGFASGRFVQILNGAGASASRITANISNVSGEPSSTNSYVAGKSFVNIPDLRGGLSMSDVSAYGTEQFLTVGAADSTARITVADCYARIDDATKPAVSLPTGFDKAILTGNIFKLAGAVAGIAIPATNTNVLAVGNFFSGASAVASNVINPASIGNSL